MTSNDAWTRCRLDDLAKIITGRTPPTAVQSHFGDEFPFLTPSDMDGRKTIETTERCLSGSGASLLKSCRVPGGSIAVSCIGWQMGKVAIVGTTAFTNQQINTIVPNGLVDPNFLYYSLSTRRDELKRLGSVGTRTPILNKTRFGELEVEIPSLSVQRRIAGILSAYDDLIENNTRRIAILEEMARALYREWFVDFRFPGHQGVRRVESEAGLIPEGWQVKPIGEVLGFHIGGGWGQDSASASHSLAARVIRGTDIPPSRHMKVDGCPLRFHTPTNLRPRRLEPGDIVFEVSGGSKGQPVGRSLLISTKLLDALDGVAICASFCKRIQAKQGELLPEVLYLHLQETYDNGQIEEFQVQSTGITNFKFQHFLDRHLAAWPPMEVQSQFVSLVRPAVDSVANLGARNATLRQTRDLLLPKLMSGELRV